MKAHETVRWHGLQIAEALELLDTNLEKGLSEDLTYAYCSPAQS